MEDTTRACRVCGVAIPKPAGRGSWAKACSDECRKQVERERHARRYAEDPGYFKQGARRWQAENRERYRARKREHNLEHPEIVAGRNRRYYLANQERLKEAARAWYRSTDYFRQNRAAHYARKRAFYLANPEWSAEAQRRRRAQKLAVGVVAFSPSLLQAKLAYWGWRCWMCGAEPTGWDHVKPLSKGGLHILANLRPACQPCNSRKLNRWPYPLAR